MEGIDQRVVVEFGGDRAMPTTPWSSPLDGTLSMPAGPIVRFFATGVVAGYCARPSRTDRLAEAVRAVEDLLVGEERRDVVGRHDRAKRMGQRTATWPRLDSHHSFEGRASS
ncbi:hypothetical protein [Streptomyces chryseus]|uniref:hypothetical protein n=1 Tax=Streptomyces chryseus TaxID=68186 RepID=UPI0016797C1D|nr:hypothetical protein [Streptomyces chryseus]